jgi:F-type H+-transporting ATPase subunit b
MRDTPVTHSTTQAEHGAGFPPFKTDSFPSQFFWLAISFVVLFVVLWRVAGPRIRHVIGQRQGQIASDIDTAGKHKSDAEAALASYETTLASARTRAHAEADENRKRVEVEVEKSKAAAEADFRDAATKAEAAIAAARAEAAVHVTKAAQDAAAAIVSRLLGDTVAPEEAEAAVRATGA